MEKDKNYRYTEDGTLLVRKAESAYKGSVGALFPTMEVWYRCSEKNPDTQYLKMLCGGWFGIHKFMEGSYLQGIFYLLTCGCFGVFYFYDLLMMICGNYFYKEICYMEADIGIERKMERVYYAPLRNKKKACGLLLVAIDILLLAVLFIYQPTGELLIDWLAKAASGAFTEEQLRQLVR